MELQKIYTDSFVEELKKNAIPEQYQDLQVCSADLDNAEFTQIDGVYNNAAKIAPIFKDGEVIVDHERMIPDKDHDFESAIALFKAYENLSPYFASRKGFWVYLSHNELYSYVKKRWGDTSQIKEHWFDIGRRGSLSGLWWAVYYTYDRTKEGDDRFGLTRQLFVNQTFRTRTFFNSTLGMNQEILRGTLRFMQKYPDLFKPGKNEGRLDYIKTYFGRLGATKELTSLTESFFMHELERKMPAIQLVQNTAQVRHDRQVWNL